MAEDCPVCGDPYEFREEGGDGDGGARIEVDDLCSADPETRWNRICAQAGVIEDGDGARAALEVFRHHWGSTE